MAEGLELDLASLSYKLFIIILLEITYILSEDSGRRERASRILWVVHVPHQKIFALQFFLWGFSWEAVRRLLKSDKVTEARCDQHNTKQENLLIQYWHCYPLFSVKRQEREKINAKVGVYQGSLSLPRGWWQKFAYKDGICLQLNTFVEQLRFTDKRIWSFPLDNWEEM